MAAQRVDSGLDNIVADEDELQDALCVLAGSDPENCSYSRGYVKRQAVFACNTCTPSSAEHAGICLACANKCHDGHDIFELYTKRNFRCDCGNSKFGGFQCHLIPTKDKENDRNLYNHNFNGCYCICGRPYPDDQDTDEMIQCVICEDWYHSRHLGCTVGEPEELQEMVCETCMNKAPFLWTYATNYAVPPITGDSHHKEEAEVVKGVEEAEKHTKPSQSADTSVEHLKQEEAANKSLLCKRTHKEMTGEVTTKAMVCKLMELEAQGSGTLRKGAVFWPYSWRSELCTCTSCKRTYVAAGVQFLMDQSDTILAYEKRGLDEPFGQNLLMALTSSMDRVQQLEVIYGVKELTTSITAFLEQCVTEGKTVTVDAVHEFFEELQAKKRRRTNAGCE
ncbi:putative E3 ubiquitin-protein ligase UBR7 [Betta splendens]|uniref:E3 ubiquitin-protein ligase UBR7 n=1 Tax=Betta splendens TaxID=158456 RepID=A0A6P7LKG6_BETSP|nr:putative E3 ubiquitin-protein ligase UBR7 [Betta splendens]